MITFKVIIEVIEEMCKRLKVDKTIRPGPESRYSNSYFITLIILQNLFGFSSETSFLRFLATNRLPGLTAIPDRSWYNRKAKKLVGQVEGARLLMLNRLQAREIKMRIVDLVPVPVITYIRASRCRSFINKQSAAFGYCAAVKTKYFGQKLTIFTTPQGLPTGYQLSLANRHDVRVFQDVLRTRDYQRVTFIGDKGYKMRKIDQQEPIEQKDNQLITPAKSNQKKRNARWEKQLLKKRKVIETVDYQLIDQMNLKRTRAKSEMGLVNRINRMITSFTFGIYFNHLFKRNILSIKSILI